MIGSLSPFWITAAIGLAVGLGIVRLLLWQRAAPAGSRAPTWRIAALIGLQLAAAILLHLTLLPPSVGLRSGALIVLTANAPASVPREAGDVLVALPEAAPNAEATRVPDLATALRRFPQVASVRIVGAGLVPRDQAPIGLPVAFEPPALPRGLVSASFPPPGSAGGEFVVGGRNGTLNAGSVELLDPAGTVVERKAVIAGQTFQLNGEARAPGLALFALRLRDAAGALVEEIAVPVETRDEPPPRVLVLAGAPGPETKYLRRWAEDSGIDLGIQIDLGAGVQLEDDPVALSASTLAEIDLVVIDDRSWEALPAGGRAALGGAVSDGLGLLLRPTAPLSAATRRDWAALGMAVGGGETTLPLVLEGDEEPAVGDEPADEARAQDLPELTRRDIEHGGAQAVSLLRDADGIALASWRNRGEGRVGVWTVADSYVLVLVGRRDAYGRMWSDLFSALARAEDDPRVRIDPLAREGRRAAICDVAGPTLVLAPDGGRSALLIDPAAGPEACAAYWPTSPGWHVAQDDKGNETPFYVQPRGATPSLVAAETRQATLEMAAASGSRAAAKAAPRGPGSPWPWFIALLVVLAGLWWLERNRRTTPVVAEN